MPPTENNVVILQSDLGLLYLFIYVSIWFVCILSVEIALGLLRLNLKRGWSVLNVDNTVASRDTLKPTWQDFSVLNFDICGFTGVIIIVVLNANFKLVSFVH